MAENDFSKFLIKEYKYWGVYIHQNQNYLGRCVVWCKREDALDLADATAEEQKELFLVLGKLRTVTKKLFQADWFNYAFLGNETRHLHGHFIPRYASSRIFMGVNFEDKLWGHNYKIDKEFVISEEVFAGIKNILMESMR
ncbi:MAG: HIT family protein [Patescibacteria group bacterium]